MTAKVHTVVNLQLKDDLRPAIHDTGNFMKL